MTTATATHSVDHHTMLELHSPSDRDLRDPEYLDAYARGRAHARLDREQGRGPTRATAQRHTAEGRGYADGYRFGWTQ